MESRPWGRCLLFVVSLKQPGNSMSMRKQVNEVHFNSLNRETLVASNGFTFNKVFTKPKDHSKAPS